MDEINTNINKLHQYLDEKINKQLIQLKETEYNLIKANLILAVCLAVSLFSLAFAIS